MAEAGDLKLLIRSWHPLITVETLEEQRAMRLIRRACDELSLPLFVWTVVEGLKRVLPALERYSPETAKPVHALGQLGLSELTAVYVFKDLIAHLKDETVARLLRDLAQQFSRDQRTMILLDHTISLPKGLDRMAVPYELRLPDDAEIETIVRLTFSELSKVHSVKAKLRRADLRAIVMSLRSLTEQEVTQAITRAVMDDECLDAADIPRLLDFKREVFLQGGVLEYIPVASEQTELGGLANLKRWLARRRGALSKEAAEFGLEPPRGILLLGVQGCGKSLAAKTVAADWSMPLLRLDPGTLYDKYVGETERRLREAFRVAEATAPAVLWIDEIEKAFASAASRSSDGGLSQRMFGTLLNWMQDHRHPIFCVATGNDISALPPELIRKGRFDEIFFVDLPEPEAREAIFSIHLRRRKRDPDSFDLPALAAAAEGFSGAEIEQAVVGGLYAAFAERRELNQRDLLDELAHTRPLSVTMAEKIAALREWASDRCVPAN